MKKKIICIAVAGMLLLINITVFSAVEIKAGLESSKINSSSYMSILHDDSVHDIDTGKDADSIQQAIDGPDTNDLPLSFDWWDATLDKNGHGIRGNGNGDDWTTPIRNQGMEQSCWAFAANGALESRINIVENDPELNIDLSERYLSACGGDLTGTAEEAFMFMRFYGGALSEDCIPYYVPNSDVRDMGLCGKDWGDEYIPVSNQDGSNLMQYSGNETRKQIIKEEIILNGPVVTGLLIPTNGSFYDFAGGYIYKHEYDPVHYTYDGHEVIIVGWDEVDNCWICKNSYGAKWGEDKNGNSWDEDRDGEQDHRGGWFRIAYNFDLAGVGRYIDYPIYDEITDLRAYAQIDIKEYEESGQNIYFHGIALGGTPPYTYHWEFGDKDTTDDRDTYHSYIKVGHYDVELTVTDANGANASDINEILIDNPPEVPEIDGLSKAKKGEPYTCTLFTTDPDGDDIYFHIDWGDNNEEWTEAYASGKEVSATHTWNDGLYIFTIKVKAKDIYDIESDWATLKVSVLKNKNIMFANQRPINLVQRLFPGINLHKLGLTY